MGSDLGKVLEWVEHGEEVVLHREGKPVARVLPVAQGRKLSSTKPSTAEEIEHYLRSKPKPRGTYSPVTGAELVSEGRGEI